MARCETLRVLPYQFVRAWIELEDGSGSGNKRALARSGPASDNEDTIIGERCDGKVAAGEKRRIGAAAAPIIAVIVVVFFGFVGGGFGGKALVIGGLEEVIESGDVKGEKGTYQRRQFPPCRQIVGGCDRAGELLELFKDGRVVRGSTGRSSNRQEQPVIVDQAAAAENTAGIQLEVLVLVSHSAPVERTLVVGIVLVEGSIERNCLPRARLEHPRDVIGPPAGMTHDASAPGLLGHSPVGTSAGVKQLCAEKGCGIRRVLPGKSRGPSRVRDCRRCGIGDVDTGDGAAYKIGNVGPLSVSVDDDATRSFPRNFVFLHAVQVHANDCAGSCGQRRTDCWNTGIVHGQSNDNVGVLYDNPGVVSVRPPGHRYGIG